MVAIGYK